MESVLRFLTRFPPGPLVAAVAILGIWLLSGSPDASQRVPDVVGQQLNPAIATVTDAGFFADHSFRTGGGIAGTVVKQSPPAGTLMNKRTHVMLVATKGLAQIKVPDVRGIPVDEARARIDRSNLIVGSITYVDDPQMASNRVIRTTPAQNTPVDVGATIDITVAS